MKPNFFRCEQAAIKLLLSQPELSLAIDVRQLKFGKKILFDTFAHYGELTGLTKDDLMDGQIKDGYLVNRGDLFLILFEETGKSSRRLNWTLAHEVGHVYLNHETDGELEEIEAHYFASQLLLPDILLVYLQRKLEILTPQMTAEFFGVSVSAARKKLETIKKNGASAGRGGRKEFPDSFSPLSRRLLERHLPQLQLLEDRCERTRRIKEEFSRAEEQWLYGFL